MLRKGINLIFKRNFSSKHYGKHFDIQFILPQSYESSKEFTFIQGYRKQGHHFCNLDPLNISKNHNEFPLAIDFGLEYTNKIDFLLDHPDFAHFKEYNLITVEDLEDYLRKIYTQTSGVEFDHIQNKEEKDWLHQNYETTMMRQLTKSEKLNIHQSLVQTEAFDHFLHKKFNTFKRYSGEGIEAQIVFLKKLFGVASEHGFVLILGVKECVIAMAHRGRMNILSNIMEYPPRDLFAKIAGKGQIPSEIYNLTDDVPHHISVSNEIKPRNGTFIIQGSNKEKPIILTTVHNPSHLEAANPNTMGKTRAKQDEYQNQDVVLNVQIHGDAAFCGQGVVYESFAMSKVPNFQIGGSIHIIANNQIGYTTSPQDQRPTKYSTEICKAFDVPIIHVNADDVETVYKLSQFVVEYRQKFKKDILIDIIGFRKYGHNELDEPEFTQPGMYEQIRKQQVPTPKKYHQQLIQEISLDEGDYDKIRNRIFEYLEKQFEESKTYEPTLMDLQTEQKGNTSLTKKWSNMNFSALSKSYDVHTGINIDLARELIETSVHHSPEFKLHERIRKFHIQERLKQLKTGKIDWATAESAAFLSLLQQGVNIRLSGQDVERGTFSQRHCILTDQKDETQQFHYQRYNIFNEGVRTGRFQAVNSPLSEFGVLGFEFGYSMENPNNLVIWEAQFGDFFNTAQVVFDTFITCSEAKWLRQSSLMCLLPHGYDGAGPEHSSSRIERFLQMASTDGICQNFNQELTSEIRKMINVQDQHFYADHRDINFQAVQPTTPANMFHIIRRQMLRDYRKPIIVFSAKTRKIFIKVLRLPAARSDIQELTQDFIPVLEYGEGKEICVLCSGKNMIKDKSKVKVLVIEELLPFPEQLLKNKLQKLNKNAKIIWAQEEPINSGVYSFAVPHLKRILQNLGMKLIYCGRRAIAQTATGDSSQHKREQKQIIDYLNQLIQ